MDVEIGKGGNERKMYKKCEKNRPGIAKIKERRQNSFLKRLKNM
jgi:hypothetical protein